MSDCNWANTGCGGFCRLVYLGSRPTMVCTVVVPTEYNRQVRDLMRALGRPGKYGTLLILKLSQRLLLDPKLTATWFLKLVDAKSPACQYLSHGPAQGVNLRQHVSHLLNRGRQLHGQLNMGSYVLMALKPVLTVRRTAFRLACFLHIWLYRYIPRVGHGRGFGAAVVPTRSPVKAR